MNFYIMVIILTILCIFTNYHKKVDFTFDNYIKYYTHYVIKLFIFDLTFSILVFYNDVFFLSSFLTLSIYEIIKHIKKINRIKNNINNLSLKDRNRLEKELANRKFIYDKNYITENYLFNIEQFEKIYYKDIIIVEGCVSIPIEKMSQIGYKLTLYLKNGKKFKITFFKNKEENFKSFLKEKNPNIFFGIKEDYEKFKEKNSNN